VVFSELLPKALTLRYVPTVAAFTAVPVVGVLVGARPLVWLMNAMADLVTRPLGLGSVTEMEREWHTAEEIRQITSQAAEHGALTPQEQALVLNSLALGKRRARQIMVPRTRVLYLDLRRPLEENRRVIGETLHTRFPLCDGGLDRVVGWVPTKEFLAAYHAEGDVQVLRLLARKPVFQPETVTLDKLLTAFRQERAGIVFLVDEYGGVEGMVTLADVVDELLAGPAAGAEGAFEVPGDAPLHEVSARLRRPERDATAATLSGLIVSKLGRVPVAGEQLTIDGFSLKVLDSDGRVVRRVLVRPQ
jgi:putative hemolysin